jgi:hypothetical protein
VYAAITPIVNILVAMTGELYLFHDPGTGRPAFKQARKQAVLVVDFQDFQNFQLPLFR